jgi:hypothetical protein
MEDKLENFKKLAKEELQEANISINDVLLNTVILRLMRKAYNIGLRENAN